MAEIPSLVRLSDAPLPHAIGQRYTVDTICKGVSERHSLASKHSNFSSLNRLNVVDDLLVTAKSFLKAWQKRTPADLMLLLEWMLIIGVALTNVLLPLPFQTSSSSSLFPNVYLWQLLTIIVFGAMGLKRPKQNLSNKILYTTAELGLVYLPSMLDRRLFFPPFYLITVIRSCSMFGNLGQLTTAIFTNLLFVISLFSQRLNLVLPNSVIDVEKIPSMLFTAQLNASFAFVFISTFILFLTNLLFFMQRNREELTQAHDRLRQYALRIEDQAMLQERTRIAREMHDALGHTLTAQSLQLDTVHCFWNSDPDKALRSLSEAKQLSAQALKEVRQTISTLRIDPLKGVALDDAIAKLIQTFHQTTGILPTCTFRFTVVPSKNVNLCVYRVIQEALTNIAKHSHATEISIYLQTTSQQLNVLIQDNGVGFDPSQNISGFGLQGIQERTLALEGLFSVVSQPGLGCKIMAQIPLTELQ
jgi:signal transduction histidine kinase